ncbi:hypothetical protein MHYP_G00158110 [Metynnis hypsauchen]
MGVEMDPKEEVHNPAKREKTDSSTDTDDLNTIEIQCDRRPSHQSNVPESRQPRAPPRAAGTAPPPSSLCCGQRRTAWPRRRGQRPPAPGGA